MKYLFFLFIVLAFFVSCNDDDSIHNNYGVAVQFKLYDTAGIEKSNFKIGESFDMIFILINTSGRDLTYYYTGTPITFEIHKSDSIIATSIDGLTFPHVILGGVVKNGERFKSNWLAPNSPARDPKISLPVGKYKAFVKHYGFFDNFKIKESLPIEFEIVD